MRKRILIFTALFITACPAWGTSRDATLTNTTGYNYNYMYPYMNNQMRTNLNPGVTTSQSLSPINTVVKTTPLGTPRRVVSRPSSGTTSRSATASRGPSARTATTRRIATQSVAPVASSGNQTSRNATNQRGVVARSGIKSLARVRSSTRGDATTVYRASATDRDTDIAPRVSSTRCLADYTECMNDYCLRPDTEYNRCYCSSRLAQIDSTYQPAIENLINQILRIGSVNNWTSDEMDEYWMSTIGKYSNENSWKNLDDALNINWADTASRVRGQNAFAMGHEYCVQYLRGCYYMAGNLRDAYRSEISRDCNIYEQSLQKIKNAAESIVEYYNE